MTATGGGPTVDQQVARQPGDGHPLLLPALMCAVAAVSTSAVIVRFSTMPPAVLAGYRLAVSSIFLLPWMLSLPRGSRSPSSARAGWLGVASGLFLGVHYALWFASLERTTIASATVLVTMHPLLIVPVSYLFWKDPLSPRALGGMIAALAGATLIGMGDFDLGRTHVAGDALALAAAGAMGVYLMIGSLVRSGFPLASYLVWVNAWGGFVVLVYAFLAGEALWPIPAGEWALIGLLAAVPTLMGHTLFNWALRHTRPSVVSVSILGEPVGATLLAYGIFGEAPGLWQSLGGLLILGGVYAFVKWREVRRDGGS